MLSIPGICFRSVQCIALGALLSVAIPGTVSADLIDDALRKSAIADQAYRQVFCSAMDRASISSEQPDHLALHQTTAGREHLSQTFSAKLVFGNRTVLK